MAQSVARSRARSKAPTFLKRKSVQRTLGNAAALVILSVLSAGAILPLSVEDKKMTQIGKVDLLKDKCVVYINHQNCGACVEVCPTKTITFINKQNVLYPVVDNRFCVGCGACSKACPTDPKSIVVHPHSVHGKAVKSLADGIPVRQKKAVPEEFPF